MEYDEKIIDTVGFGKGWIAVYKPSGLSVHNDPGNDLVSITENKIKKSDLADEISPDLSFGLNPVHRLDKETSGIIILACQKDVFKEISLEFENHRVEKRYVALVHGSLVNNDWNVWNNPVSKKAGGRKDIAGSGKKLKSETRFRAIDNSSRYSLLEIDLITGRKHQIRKHAAINKTPVVFDERYGSKRAVKYLKERFPFLRLCLHCSYISFQAKDGKRITLEVEKIPPSFARLLEADR